MDYTVLRKITLICFLFFRCNHNNWILQGKSPLSKMWRCMKQTQLRQKSLSKQACFYWSMRQIHIIYQLNPMQNLCEIPERVISDWNDWILSVKYAKCGSTFWPLCSCSTSFAASPSPHHSKNRGTQVKKKKVILKPLCEDLLATVPFLSIASQLQSDFTGCT